jgi:predicted RNA binding protein YcfA (HicA-like mRNA interferase family)
VPKLPVIAGKDLVKFLANKKGFRTIRSKGGHAYMESPDGEHKVTIIIHGKLKKGTLSAVLRQAGIEIDVFIAEW